MYTSVCGSVNPVLIFGAGSLHRLPFASQRNRVLATSLDLGFRDFDVAPAYGNGLNEIELGRNLCKVRYECRITTKFGIPVDLYGERYPSVFFLLRTLKKLTVGGYGREYAYRIFSPIEMEKSLEGSLRRLRREYVDDFMVHEPLGTLRESEVEALAEKADRLREQGKILRWGVAGPVGTMGLLLSASAVNVIQFPLEDLAVTETALEKRKIVFGVYRYYKKHQGNVSFSIFVKNLLHKNKRLNVILSTSSIETLRGFRELF